jgi:hypothetical protein
VTAAATMAATPTAPAISFVMMALSRHHHHSPPSRLKAAIPANGPDDAGTDTLKNAFPQLNASRRHNRVIRVVAVSPNGSTVFVTGCITAASGAEDYTTVACNSATGAQLRERHRRRRKGLVSGTEDRPRPKRGLVRACLVSRGREIRAQ